MSPRLQTVVVALALTVAAALPASARSLSVGVFLPNAAFTSNAERSAFAERVAAAIQAEVGSEWTVAGRAFARSSDLARFLSAGKLDLLIADPLFQIGRGGTVLAHAMDKRSSIGPPAALYAAPGTKGLAALAGRPIAVASAGKGDLTFYAATVLEGEVDPARYFGKVREAKDASAALGAVRAGAASAAFAPVGLASAAGLEVIIQGGVLPLAVLVGDLARRDGLPDDVESAVLRALTLGNAKGGGIAGWRSGGGGAMEAASRRKLAVKTEPVLLAPASTRDTSPPRVRLETTGSLPAVSVRDVALEPVLEE